MVATLETDRTPAGRGDPAAPAVLHLLPELDGAARSRAVIDMAATVTAFGARAFIAAPPGRASVDVQRAGAVHVPLPLDRDNPVAQRSNASKIEALIREQGVRLVHAHGRAPAWSGGRAARRVGAAFVSTFIRTGRAVVSAPAPSDDDADAAIAVSHMSPTRWSSVFRCSTAAADVPAGVDTERSIEPGQPNA
jgi:hypothetical protein